MLLNTVESHGDQVAYWLHQLEKGEAFDMPPLSNAAFVTALAESQGMTREDATQYLKARGIGAFRKAKE